MMLDEVLAKAAVSGLQEPTCQRVRTYRKLGQMSGGSTGRCQGDGGSLCQGGRPHVGYPGPLCARSLHALDAMSD